MGDDRAETYLRRLAETEFRRVLRDLAGRRPDGGSGPAGGLLPDGAFRPGSDIASSAAQISWVGDVLVAAGVLAKDRVSRIAAELDAALTARTRSESPWRARRLNLALERTGTWRSEAPQGQGTADLSPRPPPGARWLDLIADQTRRLIRLDLTRPKATAPAVGSATEQHPEAAPGERVLAGQAERILASAGDIGGASADPQLGEIITVLAAAGAIAPESPTPGHLAALCQRLGARGHGITATAAADIPVRWASVLAGPDPGRAGPGPGWHAPFGVVLADVDGTRFALGGLTSAAGQSHLHVVATGVPLPTGGWDPGFSWWVRDDDGNWHVGTRSYPHRRDCGLVAFRVRLTPPLDARPDRVEVVVTGPATRAGALVPVREAPECRTLST